MSLEMIAQEVQEMEKSVHMNLRKSIEFDIKGSTLKAAANTKKAAEEAKKTAYMVQLTQLGGKRSSDEDGFIATPINMDLGYESNEDENSRKIEQLNWRIDSCERKIKSSERIIEHVKDNKTYKLNEYEMEDFGL